MGWVPSENQTHESIQMGKLGHRWSITGLSVCIKHTLFIFPQPVKHKPEPELRDETSALLSLLPWAFFHAHLLTSHLFEGRPFLLLLHIRVIAWVLRVVTWVTVGVEDIGCAKFVNWSKGNAWCIPEANSAVLMSVNTHTHTRFKVISIQKYSNDFKCISMQIYQDCAGLCRCVHVCACVCSLSLLMQAWLKTQTTSPLGFTQFSVTLSFWVLFYLWSFPKFH